MSRGAKERSLGLALTVTASILFALSAGEFSALAPASLATHVPLFSSFRIPSRYTIVFVHFRRGGSRLDRMRNLEEQITLSKQARLWIGLVCVLGAFDVVQQNRAQFRGVFPYAPLGSGFHAGRRASGRYDVDTTSDPYAPDAPMLRVLMANRAFFNCYESLQTAPQRTTRLADRRGGGAPDACPTRTFPPIASRSRSPAGANPPTSC